MATVRDKQTSKGTARIIDYYDANSQRRRKTVYCSRKKAEEIAKALEGKKARINLGLESMLKPNTKLSEAIAYYKKTVQHQKKAKTLKREQLVYNAFLEYLGNIPLGNIRYRDLSQYINYRYEKDQLSEATIGIEIRTLRQFFNVLIKHEFIDKNPTQGLKGPKAEDTGIRFLTITEIHDLLEKIDDQNYKDLVQMYLNTGTRRSELLPPLFTWQNVDFQQRRLMINGKRDKVRYIPMTQTAYDILHRRKHDEERDLPFEVDYDYMYKKIKRYFNSAGLTDVTLHTLRKTYGSLLVQNGVDIFTVSKLLGHSSVKVTEQHYAALLDENLEEGIKVLDEIL